MRRNSTECIAAVLEAAKVYATGCNMTSIMYASNVNCSVLKGILKDLLKRGLLAKDGKNYFLTDQGRKVLHDYSNAWMAIVGKRIPKGLPLFLRSVPNVGWKK